MSDTNHDTEDEKQARRRRYLLVVIAVIVGAAMLALSFYAGKAAREKLDSAPATAAVGSAVR